MFFFYTLSDGPYQILYFRSHADAKKKNITAYNECHQRRRPRRAYWRVCKLINDRGHSTHDCKHCDADAIQINPFRFQYIENLIKKYLFNFRLFFSPFPPFDNTFGSNIYTYIFIYNNKSLQIT